MRVKRGNWNFENQNKENKSHIQQFCWPFQECNRTILACFLKELKVLEQDVEEKDKQHVINIEKNLQDFKVLNLLQVLSKKKK